MLDDRTNYLKHVCTLQDSYINAYSQNLFYCENAEGVKDRVAFKATKPRVCDDFVHKTWMQFVISDTFEFRK